MRKSKADKKSYFQTLASLCLIFLKIGAFTFGGGYAMIALIEKEMVEKRKWLTEREMLDMLAIAEATPGVISLNTATFVGAKLAGFWGAFLASISVLLPAMVIITLLHPVIDQFGENQYVRWAFMGVRAAVAALILNAVVKFIKPLEKSLYSFLILGLSLTLAVLSTFEVIRLDILYIILAAAATGLIYGIIQYRKKPPQNSISIDNDTAEASPAEKFSAPEESSPKADDDGGTTV